MPKKKKTIKLDSDMIDDVVAWMRNIIADAEMDREDLEEEYGYDFVAAVESVAQLVETKLK